MTNNVVAVVQAADREYIVSLLGLGSGKTWRDLRAGGFALEVGAAAWTPLPAVPDGQARLAASAATVDGGVFIFGGYTVAEDGSETSTPYVYRLDVVNRRYERLADMPTPVDDSVALVQLYDSIENRWQQATAFPGAPIFGHAGAIAGGRMKICDGVRVTRDPARGKYAPFDECWLGTIGAEAPARIDWTPVPPHPGRPRYRMGVLAHRDRFLFLGGSENPYNYDGIGYDGRPSEPESEALMFDLTQGRWYAAIGPPIMDLRSLALSASGLHVVGGMRGGQTVSAAVERIELKQAP